MKKLTKYSLVVFLCLLCLRAQAQNSPPTQSQAKVEILRLQSVYESAVATKNLTAIMEMYEEEAVYLPFQHVILHGKEEIKKAWQRTFQYDLGSFDLELVSVDVQGDFLFEVGRTHSIFNLPSGQMPGEFKYLNVWRRQSDGTYKIYRATYNQWVDPNNRNN